MQNKVLIADDDPVARHILTAMLESGGYAVDSVDSGRGCISAIKDYLAKNEMPIVLFLDLQLNDMRGTDVVAAIRSLMKDSHLPIIMLSANTRAEMLEDEPDHLPDHYLEKPFRTEDVLGALATVLKVV